MDEERLNLRLVEGARPGQKILHLEGVLTIRTMFDFQTEVRNGGPDALILDFQKLEYMDSTGLGSLIGAYTSFERKGKRLLFAGMSDRVWTLFRISHIDTRFTRYSSVGDAQQALSVT